MKHVSYSITINIFLQKFKGVKQMTLHWLSECDWATAMEVEYLFRQKERRKVGKVVGRWGR
jgi:hypothetical protein